MEVLKPLMRCTKKVEGNANEGRNDTIWEVLPAYEYLLHHFESLKMQYNDVMIHSDDKCNHLHLNIQLGWQKVNEYYDKLNNSAVYVAAFLLHPKYQLVKLKSLWSSKID